MRNTLIFILFGTYLFANLLSKEVQLTSIKTPEKVKEEIQYYFNNSLENITTGRILSLYSDIVNYQDMGEISIIKLSDKKDLYIEKFPYIKHTINKIGDTHLDNQKNYIINVDVDFWSFSFNKELGIKGNKEFQFIFDKDTLKINSENSKVKYKERYTPLFNNKLSHGYYIFNASGGSGTSSSLSINDVKNNIIINSYGLGGTSLVWKGTKEEFINQKEFLLIEDIICRKDINECAKLYKQKEEKNTKLN